MMEILFVFSVIVETLILFVLIKYGNVFIDLFIRICADVSFIKDLISKEKADEVVERLIREGYIATKKKVE